MAALNLECHTEVAQGRLEGREASTNWIASWSKGPHNNKHFKVLGAS